MAVKPIPDGYPRVSANLAVDGAADAIEFYKSVFGATERLRMEGAPGQVIHAELEIGDSVLMLADEAPKRGFLGPKKLGGTPVTISLYVEDVDVTYAAAVEAGATELRAPDTKFYGERTAQLEDPWGHHWSLVTRVEDVSPEELDRRMQAMRG